MMYGGKRNVQPMVQVLLLATLCAGLMVFYFSKDQSKIISADILGWSNNTRSVPIEQAQCYCERIVNESVPSSTDLNESRFKDFLPLVERAATDDKTVILTSVNEAWAAPGSFLALFLECFRNGEQTGHLLSHLIIVAMDPNAFQLCKSVHPHCYLLQREAGADLSAEKVYMSRDYIELVWSKLKLQQVVLDHGYNFLFTDVDIMWFRNPLRHISVYHDLTLSSDVYFGNPEDLGNMPNTGLIYVKSTKNNIELLKYWHKAKDRFPPSHEQYVFDQIKYEIAAKFELKIHFVDTAYWGGFCHPKKDFNKLCTFHGNCLEGLKDKLFNLRLIIEEWKKYKSTIAEKPYHSNTTMLR